MNNPIASLNNAREEGREGKTFGIVFDDVHQRLFGEEVKNNERLDGCEGPHDFVPMLPISTMNAYNRFECCKCKGTMNFTEKRLYDQGLKHGRL